MSLSKQVIGFMLSHPELERLRKQELLNLSAISRKIISETGLPKQAFSAVLAALRRMPQKTKGADIDMIRVLKTSTVNTYSNLKLDVGDKVSKIPTFQVRTRTEVNATEGGDLTLIELALKSPCPGLDGFILGLLDVRGIRTIAIVSTTTAVSILIQNKDAPMAMAALDL